MPAIPASVLRLATALALMTVGSGAMYVVVVVLPAVQQEFGVDRASASLPYTLTLIGFGIGGVLMGRLADRFGIAVPLAIGACGLAAGYALSALAPSLTMFAIAHGLLLGMLGCSATFSPLIADTSLWFTRRRGIAVTICASGNYVAGALWPPIVQRALDAWGWRQTYLYLAVFCLVTMLPLTLAMRRRPPLLEPAAPGDVPAVADGSAPVTTPAVVNPHARPIGMAPGPLQTLLCIAGVACCVAMSMPQVHIVAYCADLGFGVARGAEMLSLMLGFGIVSRVASGFICDRIGGLKTLLIGSVMQGIALILFLPADTVMSLYLVSILFGLFQGGIVPMYAIVVRENFPAAETGGRVGLAITATLIGMALGGWLSGKLFDLTGSYQAAFLNGIGWNAVNVFIVVYLLLFRRRSKAGVGPYAVARSTAQGA
jgi:MFS family permease